MVVNRGMTSSSPLHAISRSTRILFCMVVAGFLLSLLAGMLVPVYSDEIGWRFQERAGIDGFDSLYNDLCGPNTIARPPWQIMPVRWFSAWANLTFASPLFIRLEGVMCALAWAGLVWLLIKRVEVDRERRFSLGTIAYGLLSLGTLPLLLVMSRPEQPLILTTTLIVLVACARIPASIGVGIAATLKVLLILILSVIAQSYHMKGVLYGGVALIAMWACEAGARTIVPRMIGLGLLLASLASSTYYWVDRLKCFNVNLAAKHGKENIAAVLAEDKSIMGLFPVMLRGANPFNYFKLTVPRPYPMSLWLPEGVFTDGQSVVFWGALSVCWGGALAATIAVLIRHVREQGLAGLIAPRFMLSAGLLGSVLIWGASQLNRNDYEAEHVLPVIVLAFLCALTLPAGIGQRARAHMKLAAPIIAVASWTSLLVVYGSLAAPLWAALKAPGYVAGQPLSLSIGGFDGVRKDVKAAMISAGMPTTRPLNRPLLDELTYLPLQDSRLPLHRLGVLWIWNGGLEDPVPYLLSRHSDGIVVGCAALDQRLLSVASRAGSICAISAATLERVHVLPLGK